MAEGAGLATIHFQTQYRTGDTDPAREFYRPCLFNAIDYKRAVGYFRSSVYLIIGSAIVDFARRGGHIRLICSPSLTEEDVKIIEEGYAARELTLERVLSQEIDQLLANENTTYRTQILATLVSIGALDIRLALRPEAYGLYHEKLGIFCDSLGQKVSFLGSANETWNGWHQRGNHEAIEVFCNWNEGADVDRVRNHDAYFDRLWEGRVPNIEIALFPEAAKKRLETASFGNLETIDSDNIDKTSMRRIPLAHQRTAIDAWKAMNQRGVFQHATGSGKTFTAIIAIKEHVSQGLPAIILVPSTLLLEQWSDEIKADIPEAVMLLAGAGNDRWKQDGRLRSLTDPSPELGPRIVLSTMQTAATEAFYRRINGGKHLMIVADEVHQVGSTFNSNIFNLDTGPRLGLSATPFRYGDPVGTANIFKYFGDIVPPPITLQDAINSGRLVEYEYHPHPVYLSSDEAESWKTITRQISLEVSRQKADANGSKPFSERAKMLLIRRSRIAKKARQKIHLAAQLIKKNYEQGQHWLLYCEDRDQLKEVMQVIREVGLNPVEYHTGMDGDRAATLSLFRMFGGILVSIKCLDEGIDIPSISHAMILASSQNPRQFIQRRGRVLRKIPGKYIAVLHDAIVVPVSLEEEPEQLSLLKSEFLRAIEFAGSAINKTAAAELRAIAASMGFDPDEHDDNGMEEE